ncbi:MAG: hypothetical protein OEY51_03735 [Cyclobacteriaceae bacterium]|nr:hypothetical protein [Cyclobacteriaceae bacterium]
MATKKKEKTFNLSLVGDIDTFYARNFNNLFDNNNLEKKGVGRIFDGYDKHFVRRYKNVEEVENVGTRLKSQVFNLKRINGDYKINVDSQNGKVTINTQNRDSAIKQKVTSTTFFANGGMCMAMEHGEWGDDKYISKKGKS